MEIQKRYELGERNFPQAQLQQAKLRALNLSYVNLKGADLSYADLTESDLNHADLRDCLLKGAYLQGANLIRANLTGASLNKTNLNGSSLNNARLNVADLHEAFLTKTSLEGANLTEANLKGVHLNEANLTRANLTRANLTKAFLTKACLAKANLNGADLSDAYLNGADLSGANLKGAYYNENTRFDETFDPAQAGMHKLTGMTTEDLLKTFNYLLQLSAHYLGNFMTVKYWQEACPDFAWFTQFQVDSSAQVTFSRQSAESIDALKLHWSQQWANTFIQHCSQIIQNFPSLIDRDRCVIAIAPATEMGLDVEDRETESGEYAGIF
jgi:uncharacterized protein YjbI with pentapeptide repeats